MNRKKSAQAVSFAIRLIILVALYQAAWMVNSALGKPQFGWFHYAGVALAVILSLIVGELIDRRLRSD